MATNTGSVRAQKAQTWHDFKKAALTELKGEKGRICCLFWMFIVIGSEAKKSLGWFLQFRWGPGVEVEVFMRRIKLLFGSTLVQLSSTTGSPTSSLAKRRTKAMSTRIRKFFFPQIFFCGCENFRVHTQRIRIVFSRPHVSDCIRKFSDLL